MNLYINIIFVYGTFTAISSKIKQLHTAQYMFYSNIMIFTCFIVYYQAMGVVMGKSECYW